MRMTAYLLSAAATIALTVPAFAQDVPTTQPEAQTVPSNTSGTAAASVDAQQPPVAANAVPQATDTQPVNAGDIVITATRRSERLSNVPIAVSAVGQAALQNSGATDIRQMTQLAPSLLISSTVPMPRIRAEARSVTIQASKARSRCSSTASIAAARGRG